ANSRWQVTRV
nr:Chain C, kCAL01 peptide [synthetic construct]6OV7_D Chain D, kCAL01 peptide [synthetic construct]